MHFSRFADHFTQDSGILQLMNDLGHTVNQDIEFQSLGGGNPASITQVEQCFRQEMENILKEGNRFERMIGNYDAPQGNQSFLTALSEFLQVEFSWPVEAKNIAVTNGSQASFGILFNLFAGEYRDGTARRILLPITPEYIGYENVGLGSHPLFIANRPVITKHPEDDLFFKYRFDFDNLVIGDDIGAVCISRPTNPTGNVVTEGELDKLSKMVSTRGIPLILDGAYGLPFPGIVFCDAQPRWSDDVILCLSLSKLGLPGTRTGIIIAHESVIRQITSANAVYNLAPGRFGPTLVTRLIQNRKLISLCQEVIRPYYQERSRQAIARIREKMADLPVRVHLSEGAIFLWLWFKGLPISSETLYQNLKRKGVLVVAGHHFFPGLEESWEHKHECIRVSYAADPLQVSTGLDIIAQEVRKAYHST